MTTAPPGEPDPRGPRGGRQATSRSRRVALFLAGPSVIVLAVFGVLHAFAFQGRISNGDPPTYWLPTWCFLGQSLRAGHVPLWNPYTLAGTPFAADPQSGWMYLPPMVLFTVLPCGAAIRWLLLLQPIVAGLGLLWFLRIEGLARVAAAVGGIVLALVVAGSEVVLSLPFAGMLAWTTVSLALVARVLRAPTWPRRLGWIVLASLSWGQLAAAHLSVGLALGTAALAFYVAMRVGVDATRRTRTVASSAATLAVLVASMAVVNLGYLLPRLAYASRTNLGPGYAALERTTERLTGRPVLRLIHPPSAPPWPLKFATTPGAHVGAAALALVFAALWSRRHRPLAIAFALFGLACYLATLRAVAAHVPAHVRSFRVFDFYLHSPEWFGYPVLLSMAVLAAIGLDAWTERRGMGERVTMVAPGVLVWGILPPLFGGAFRALVILIAGALVAVATLWLTVRRPDTAWVVAAAIVIEMTGAGLFVGAYRPPFGPGPSLLTELPPPSVDPARYLQATQAERVLTMRRGRFVAAGLPGWSRNDAAPPSSVLRVQSAQGYSPTALARYWYFVRAVVRVPLDYNLTLLIGQPRVGVDLLGVRSIMRPRPPAGIGVVPADDPPPMVTFFSSWSAAASPGAALRTVSRTGFDAERTVVLERTPPRSAGPVAERGATSFAWTGVQSVRVHIDAPVNGVAFVRIPFDTGWCATVDGRPADVVPADYVDLAVPVSRGTHTIVLDYRDPWVWYGLAGSGAGLSALGLGALAAAVVRRRRANGRERS